MSGDYFDGRLRFAFEFVPAAVHCAVATVLLCAPELVYPILPQAAQAAGAAVLALGALRFGQGVRLLSYRQQLRHLPRYVLDAEDTPVSGQRLFLGRGFAWDQRHSQRLVETRVPGAHRYLQPGRLYQAARNFEIRYEHSDWAQPLLQLIRSDHAWNPPFVSGRV